MGFSRAKRAARACATGLAVAAFFSACSPTLRGRCASDTDCRQGSVCAAGGICISASGTCTPACALGELCSEGVCTTLKASVAVQLPASALIGPQRPLVQVQVAAATGVTLGTLEVDVLLDPTHLEAKATLASPQQGLNTLTLTSFHANHAGPVTVIATLPFTDAAGNAGKVQSVAVAAFYDSQGPQVSVFVPAQDSVNGWFPRAGADVEVRAQVDDQGGSGPASAALTFASCPASSPCTIPGTLVGAVVQGVATYSFALPRSVQPAGSEDAIPFSVRAVDLAGNGDTGSGTLQIDDKPPTIASAAVVTQGATGEDGKPWFPAGPKGVTVEISVALTDAGAGVDPNSVALLLNQADVDPGTTLRVPPVLPLPGDGTAHFLVSTTVTSGREGPVRFSVVAQDGLQHATSFTPGASVLCVDDVAPTVALAKVDYATALPSYSSVCAAGVSCGRGAAAAPDHLLRDDTATVTFDAYDCGAGLGAPAQPGFIAVTSAGSVGGTVAETGTQPSTCANGNALHHYAFQLRLSEDAPALDPSDLAGSTTVRLTSRAVDRIGNVNENLPQPADTDGIARVSLVRWRASLTGLATGAGALLPGTAPRRLVLGIAGTPNLLAFNSDGSTSFKAALSTNVQGDVAVGPSGTIYAVAAGSSNCGSPNCGNFNLVVPPASSTTTTATPLTPCSLSGATLGAPPSIFSAAGAVPERAVAVATARDQGMDSVYLFAAKSDGSSCKQETSTSISSKNLSSIGELTGVSGSSGALFASHADGFTSLTVNGVSFGNGGAQVQYDSASDTPLAKAPPALSFTQGTVLQPIFASASTDQHLRATTVQSGCAGPLPPASCYKLTSGFTAAAGDAGFSATPVFDASAIYAADDAGNVYSWSISTGTQQGKVALGQLVSAPELLDGGAANPLLVVSADGKVHLLTPQPMANQVLVQVGAFGSGVTPQAPAIDRRDLLSQAGAVLAPGGVAYVTDGLGVLWALQLPRAPLAASSTAWPRPGRDSCNSRNLASGSGCP